MANLLYDLISMPELPEVETVVEGLKEYLIKHRIQAVDIKSPRSFSLSKLQMEKFVIGAEIIGLQRLGKVICIDLDSRYSLTIHLKMTGQLIYQQIVKGQEKRRFGAGHPTDSFIGSLPDKTTRAIFQLSDNGWLFFNDMRKFGWIRLIPTAGLDQETYIQTLGVDAMTISSDQFVKLFSRPQRSIKACLLDQTLMAGCGNIYADESLWKSQISPLIPAHLLTKKQLKQLHQALLDVLTLSIKQGGSSSRNYVNAKGEKGKYLDFAYVYQRTGQPCRRCQTEIKRIVVVGRGTHICPVCQRC
ncbi:MAG: bifunctional DNA-formamidopyrimidine glycosylase/DNA-(apurinic or apyrimidinic site) lyase [Candidatus Saccharibacteria bacterium]|nr:bifunctional DNA-formamidopyrimidine glycosylase/DNA-(apurinic or apyrimidinic site) lyase [Candidatus Saccharibacteria bacterium]